MVKTHLPAFTKLLPCTIVAFVLACKGGCPFAYLCVNPFLISKYAKCFIFAMCLWLFFLFFFWRMITSLCSDWQKRQHDLLCVCVCVCVHVCAFLFLSWHEYKGAYFYKWIVEIYNTCIHACVDGSVNVHFHNTVWPSVDNRMSIALGKEDGEGEWNEDEESGGKEGRGM